jgi:hypothetical protein
MGKLWDNNCHWLTKQTCYLNQDKRHEVLTKLFKLQNAHLFKDAVPCAERVFANTFFDQFAKDIALTKHKKLSYLE